MRLEPIANPQVLQSLPEAQQVYARSYLTSKNGEVLYTFLFNPEVLDFRKSVRYSEVEVGGTAIQPQNYKNTSGTTLKLDNIQFDTYCEKRSARQLIEGLGRLTLPDPQTLKPVLVSFVYGSFTFGPAIITDLAWQNTSLLNGEAAIGTLNISLTEVPSSTLPSAYSTRRVQAAPNTVASSSAVPAGDTASRNAAPTPALTTRQQETVRAEALAYIGANLNRFPVDVRQAFSADRLRILIPSASEINMADNSSNLGRFGSYNLETQKLEPLPGFL